MLARLARLLRAAGYDTYLAASGEDHAALLTLAHREGRILVSRDKRLAAAAAESVLVSGFGVNAEAHSLSRAVVMDWTFAPFSRCMADNARLREATPAEVAALPADTAALEGPFRVCSACGRGYWPGSQTRRVAEQLKTLARDAAIPPQA